MARHIIKIDLSKMSEAEFKTTIIRILLDLKSIEEIKDALLQR